MKIGIFSDNFYPELSGISDSLIALIRQLAGQGHTIHIFAPQYSAKDYQTAHLLKTEINLRKEVKVHRFFSLPFSGATKQARAVIPLPWRWLTIRRLKLDIIHTQLFYGVGLEALLAAKLNRIPIIGTNHTAVTEFIKYSPIKAVWFKKFSLQYAVWYYNQCDFVTAPSQSVFTEMISSGFRQPHRVISNPIDLETFYPADPQKIEARKQEFNLSKSTIVYAGRIAGEKNLDVIVRAIAIVKEKIPDVNLAIAGHGSAETEIKILAKNLNLESQIKFFGTLDKPTLARLYQASKIFAIASTSETQSLTLMQAMACGLPAIGVKSRALPEYINAENGFLIEPGDHQALAEKIIFLLENPEIHRNLGRGAANFLQKFSAPEIASLWKNLYEQVTLSYNRGIV